MLNPQAVSDFLKRKLDNYDWIKQYTAKELNADLLALKPTPILAKKLWTHQKACFLLMWYLKRFMLFIDMGGGKTLLTLSYISYLKQRGDKPKAIVFVPYLTAVDTWVTETETHAPDLICVPLVGSTLENKFKLLNATGDLFVISYPSAVAMAGDLKSVQTKGKTKRKRALSAAKTASLFKEFNVLVMDEIHKNKSVVSLTYRMCRAISKRAEHVFGLTGTPFGRDLLDLWPQFYLIDLGETLGTTLGMYREVFFRMVPKYFGGFDFKFKKKLMPDLKAVIKNRSIRYSIDELRDMPPKTYVKRKVNLTDSIREYYDKGAAKLERIVRSKTGSYKEIESAYTQLRQLSSGFMTFKGEDNSKVEVSFEDNPKLECLEELIDTMPSDSKMIVFHSYIHTNKLISERLKKMKIGHARIWGGQKDQLGELRRFRNEPTCRILVINDKMGSSSLNLQIANYVVFFEQPTSAIDRQQAERRTWRPGQNKRVYYFDILMKRTYDQKQHKANEDGRSLLKSLLDRTKQ